MSLNPVAKLAQSLASTANEQSVIKQNISGDDDTGVLQLQLAETVVATGDLGITAIKHTYAFDSFVIDHPDLGVIGSRLVATGLLASSNIVFYTPNLGSTGDISDNALAVTTFNLSNTTDRFDRSDRAYAYNGTSSYQSYTTPGLAATSDKTILSWFKLGADSVDSPTAQPIGATDYFRLHVRNSTNILYARYDYSSAVSDTITIGAGDRSWHLAVGTFKNNGANYTVTAYLDGVSSGSPTTNANAPTSNPSKEIGKHGSSYFNGAIGEFIVLNKALSDAEVTAIYNFLVDNVDLLELDGGYEPNASTFPITFPILLGEGEELFNIDI